MIVKFSFFKDKEKVLKRYRKKRKEVAAKEIDNELHGGGAEGGDEDADSAGNDIEDTLFRKHIHASEDFPSRVMKCRNDLRSFLRDTLKASKNAYIKYDELVIEKDTFMYDENTEDIKQ